MDPRLALLGVAKPAGLVQLMGFDLFKFGILKLEITGLTIPTVAIDLSSPLRSIVFIGETTLQNDESPVISDRASSASISVHP